MAAGTVDRHAARGRHHLREHVIEIIGPGLAPQDGALRLHLPDEIPGTGHEKPTGHDRGGVVRRDHVAGHLLPQERVVGLVGIEGVDHPVAIAPCMGAELIALVAMAVGVVGDIEPVPGPALPVAGRGQEPIDEALEGVRGRVGLESGHLCGGRREADEIERRPTDERPPIGFRGRGEAALLEASGNEGVDRRTADGIPGNVGADDRLPGPVVEPRIAPRPRGPLRPGIDPRPHQLDLLRREGFPPRRHARFGIGRGHPVMERA